jgi:hypothetical protein
MITYELTLNIKHIITLNLTCARLYTINKLKAVIIY